MKMRFELFILFFVMNIWAKKMEDISWQSSNIMFDISNTDHVKKVHVLDRVTILCPPPTLEGFYEYSKLFMVSKEGYDECELRDEKQLGVCTNPEQQSSISLVFRDFSPLPSALKFQAGQSYYVISKISLWLHIFAATSDGTKAGLNGTSGGLCATRNMKMKFDVLPEKTAEFSTEPQSLVPEKTNFEDLANSKMPIMYIIHTAEPESAQIANKSTDFYFKIKGFLLYTNEYFFRRS